MRPPIPTPNSVDLLTPSVSDDDPSQGKSLTAARMVLLSQVSGENAPLKLASKGILNRKAPASSQLRVIQICLQGVIAAETHQFDPQWLANRLEQSLALLNEGKDKNRDYYDAYHSVAIIHNAFSPLFNGKSLGKINPPQQGRSSTIDAPNDDKRILSESNQP